MGESKPMQETLSNLIEKRASWYRFCQLNNPDFLPWTNLGEIRVATRESSPVRQDKTPPVRPAQSTYPAADPRHFPAAIYHILF